MDLRLRRAPEGPLEAADRRTARRDWTVDGLTVLVGLVLVAEVPSLRVEALVLIGSVVVRRLVLTVLHALDRASARRHPANRGRPGM